MTNNFYDPGTFDARSYNAGFDDGVMKGRYESDNPEIDAGMLREIIRHTRISYSAWYEIDNALRDIVGEYNARVARSQKSATDK